MKSFILHSLRSVCLWLYLLYSFTALPRRSNNASFTIHPKHLPLPILTWFSFLLFRYLSSSYTLPQNPLTFLFSLLPDPSIDNIPQCLRV